MALSRPFKEDRRALHLSMPLSLVLISACRPSALDEARLVGPREAVHQRNVRFIAQMHEFVLASSVYHKTLAQLSFNEF